VLAEMSLDQLHFRLFLNASFGSCLITSESQKRRFGHPSLRTTGALGGDRTPDRPLNRRLLYTLT
jgi:hypothetical protein